MKRQTIPLLALALVLTACGAAGENPPSPQPDEPAETAAPDGHEGDTSRVAEASDMAEIVDVAREGMEPVYAADLRDGTYAVTVDSSSSMFRVTDCAVTVSCDSLTAVMTMGGTGYRYVYSGTAQEAASAPVTSYIPYEETDSGAHTFTIPIDGLDVPVLCAAFSGNRELWYDRTLVFRADSLPVDAFAEGVLHTPESLGLADGAYKVEVALTGGSGRASVVSPVELQVTDGNAAAVIIWNSSHYDYMVVNGERLEPVYTDDAVSEFSIPVAVFDRPLSVLADTTAMSTPHEIAYTLRFDSATLRPRDSGELS